MSNPFFSVIIPTHNRAALLADAVGSVRAQRYTNFELIVVDDGSTDDTAALLDGFAGCLKWYRQDRRGPGASRNLGASHATGDYLAFLDSDDLWFPWSLEVFHVLIERYHQPAVLAGNYVQFENNREVSELREEPAQALCFVDYLASWPQHRVTGAGMVVIRRDVFLAAGGFAPEPCNMEDHDLALRLGVAEGFVQVANVTLAWRRHTGSTTSAVAKTLEGCRRLIETERSGRYPGGVERAHARRHIITQHARSAALEGARAGLHGCAWEIYLATLPWNLALGRWKYVLAFPPFLLFATAANLLRRPRPGRR